MPSSISSFEHPCHRAPGKRWWLVWSLSLLLAGIGVSSAEWFWRSRGHRPSVVDTPELWSFHRSQVSDGNPRRVVLLGASRIQLGFSTDTFRNCYPNYEVTQLAIDGRHPIAALRDLAKDEDFRGIVVCAITARGFLRDTWNDQQEYVDHYHDRWASYNAIGTFFDTSLKGNIVVLSPQVRVDVVVRALLARDPLPMPSYLVTRTDRSRLADYSLVDFSGHRKHRLERLLQVDSPTPTPERWMEDVKVVNELVRQIEERGGRVVFVRFPTSGLHWKIDNQRYPKIEYWDRMASYTDAETVHFMDTPSLQQFDLPDTSHLDRKDSPAFTIALLECLRKQRVIVEPPRRED